MKFDISAARLQDGPGAPLLQSVEVGTIADNFPLKQLPEELRFSPMGGVSPIVRASVPQVVFMVLAGSGVVAAMVGVQVTDESAAFSCALAAAVNFLAAFHYYIVWQIRGQNFPAAYMPLSSGRDIDGRWRGRAASANDAAKMYAQDLAVDALRYSDWSVTLPLLVLDLMHLASHATGGATPLVSQYGAAATTVAMVALGGVWRFYTNELRGRGRAGLTCDADCQQLFFGGAAFLGSCLLFGVVMVVIMQPIVVQACAPGANATSGTKCPITDPSLKSDADAVVVLTWVWIGYPVVSLATRGLELCGGKDEDGRVSLLRDLGYGALDVVAKGGVAMFVSYRTTWS